MLKTFTALALAIGLLSCGDEAEVEELKQYVKAVQKLRHYNVQVENYIYQLNDPTIEKTEEDIGAARKLLDDYAAAAGTLAEPDDGYLRSTHELFLRSFVDAARVATDRTGDLKRQAHSVKIGFSNLRSAIRGRVLPTLELLLSRKDLDTEEYALKWPEKE